MTSLHVHDWGATDAEPVVCVHGVTGHGRRYRKLAEERLTERFRVIAPDLRGHGRSPWEPPWSASQHVADLIAVADERGLDRASWVGMSFGGRLVAELAARHPDRVDRLVLLDPALELPAEGCLEAAELEREDRSFGSVDEAVEERLAAGTLLHTPRKFVEEDMREHLARTEDGRLVPRYCKSAAIAAWSVMSAPAPPAAEVPTLFVRGERSWIDFEPQLERYRAALGRQLEVFSVPGGHSVMWDAFGMSSSGVAEFLAASQRA